MTWDQWMWNGGLDPATAEPTELRRRRALSAILVALVSAVALLVVVDVFSGDPSYIVFIEVAGLVTAPLVLWVQAGLNRARLAGHLVVAVLMAGIAAIAWVGIGLYGSTIWWLAAVPLVAVLLGLGPGIAAWSVAALATIAAIALWHPGLPPEVAAAYPGSPHGKSLDVAVFVILVAGVSLTFRHIEMEEHRRQARVNEALQRENAIRREAEQAARDAVAARERFLATVSHELRTPLNGVVGAAELLRDTPLSGTQRELVGTVHGSGRTLLALINDLLDLSKLEAGQLACERVPVHLLEVAEELVGSVGVVARAKGVDVRLSWADDVPEAVCGDPVRLRQILLNLLGNALKFTERGEVVLQVERQGDRLRLAVRDTGIGIPADALDRLFVAFEQAEVSTSRRFGGTGLGLAIVKKLAMAQGGDVTVASTVGEGSTFTVDLPLVAASVARSTATPTPAPVPAARILVVDDNAVNLTIARRLLERDGHHVDAVASGEAAIERVQARAYDLVFMDCHMPGVDGFEATRRIRALGLGPLAIVALTANTAAADRHAALDAGMDDHLSKPIEVASLRAMVARWTGRRLAS